MIKDRVLDEHLTYRNLGDHSKSNGTDVDNDQGHAHEDESITDCDFDRAQGESYDMPEHLELRREESVASLCTLSFRRMSTWDSVSSFGDSFVALNDYHPHLPFVSAQPAYLIRYQASNYFRPNHKLPAQTHPDAPPLGPKGDKAIRRLLYGDEYASDFKWGGHRRSSNADHEPVSSSLVVLPDPEELIPHVEPLDGSRGRYKQARRFRHLLDILKDKVTSRFHR